MTGGCMSLSINDLQKDTLFLLDGAPHQVLEVHHKKMARQGATLEVKCRNLINKTNITRTFFPSDKFEYAEINKKEMVFLYHHREEYWFVGIGNKSDRVSIARKDIDDVADYLLPNTEVVVEYFNNTVIGVRIPIKVDMEVIEAPPSIKGNTVSSGTKQVVVASGMSVKTPLFIQKGDVIRINTQKGEYVERVQKAGI